MSDLTPGTGAGRTGKTGAKGTEGIEGTDRTDDAVGTDRADHAGLDTAGDGTAGRDSDTGHGSGHDTGHGTVFGGETEGGRDGGAAPAATTAPAGAAAAVERDRSPGGAETPAGGTGPASGGRLLAREECDKLAQRLQHAVTGFVDGPREAVQEADHVLEELASRFTEALAHRRRTLRTAWQSADEGGPATSTDTEQLRLALRDYRELAQRLLHF
jgi:hypothetical protein